MLRRSNSDRGRWIASGVVLLAMCVGAGASETGRLTLLMTSGSSGKLLEEETDSSAAVLAATVADLAAKARADGRSVLVIDGGRTLAPYAESRFDGGAAMIELLAAMGCQAFAPAPIDLSLGRPVMEELGATSPFPILLPVAVEKDVGLSTTVLRPVDGPPVLLASLLDPVFMGDVAAAGYEATAPAAVEQVARQSVDALRVAIVHSRGRGDSMTTRQLSWRVLENPYGLDVLIDPDFGQEVVVQRQSEHGPVWLLGRPEIKAAHWSVAVIELEIRRTADGWDVVEARQEIVEAAPGTPVDARLDARVRESFERFRASLADPLPPEAPRRREGLEAFVLDAMRERADAEVAVINRGGLRPVHTQHFAAETLSREAVMRLLSFDQILVAGEISGATLEELVADSITRVDAAGAPNKSSLLFAGVTYDVEDGQPTSIKVNGRPLYPDDPYRVATTGFLAAGGDNYPQLEALDGMEVPTAGGRPAEVRETVVMPRLEEAARPFVNLEEKPLWRYSVDRVRVSLDAVSTSRDASYDEASDSRARARDSGSLLFDVWLWADREMPRWTWENDLLARFGLIDAEGREPSELDDDLQIDSAALFTSWGLLGGAHPFVNLKLDSEFRRNEDDDGTLRPRQFEQTLGAGISWSFPRWPRLRLAAVGRHYSNIDRAAEVGVTAEAWYEWKSSGRGPGLDGRFTLEYLSGSSADVRRADLDLRLTWVIANRMLFTPGINYYVYDDSTFVGTARYGRLTLGLTYSWSDKHQTR